MKVSRGMEPLLLQSAAVYLPVPTCHPACSMQEEIYSSSYAAAAYLDSIHFPKDKKVYVVGEVRATNRGEAAVGGAPRREGGRGWPAILRARTL